MPSQIRLAWDVDVTNSSFGPAQAAAALSAVPLYGDVNTDPVLGQMFGLTVSSDVSSTSGSVATRTLTLNLTPVGGRPAPPPFPCHPLTSTPPVLPYPLRKSVSLVGSFFVSMGSMSVPTTATQLSGLVIGDTVQFLSQKGVFYKVGLITATTMTLTSPYTGTTGNTGAFKEIAAPVTNVAVYSTSDLDTNGVAISPALPAGCGARAIAITYKDSSGSGIPFTVMVPLTGKCPTPIPLAFGSIDIAEIEALTIANVGSFGNSVGQLTVVGLSEPLPAIPPTDTAFDFAKFTDEAQLLIDDALVYMPPSYFALAQQGTSYPPLEGDFLVSTGAVNVRTTVDQTGVLAPGDVLQFASQLKTSQLVLGEDRDDPTAFATVDVLYTVAIVTPKIVTLTTPYTGLERNLKVGASMTQDGPMKVASDKLPTAAFRPVSAVPPSSDQLSAPLGQFVVTEVAAPPLNPPLTPMTVPPPTFLSGYFTQTLQLAMAGVPVVPQPIAVI